MRLFQKLTLKLWTALLLLLPLNLPAHYKLAICAMFQDEAPYLREWIEFHKILGVEHFYLYNDGSYDNFAEVLQPYLFEGSVTLTNWGKEGERGDWNGLQEAAYADCLEKVRDDVHWLAIIDIDEFIVPVYHPTLIEFLQQYHACAGIKIAWQDFGTSFVEDLEEGKTLIESLVYKAHKNDPINNNHKTICQPKLVKKIQIHDCDYLPPFHSTRPLSPFGRQVDPRGVEAIRLQHYWTRTNRYFREIKIPRRERIENRAYCQEEIHELNQKLNAVVDRTAFRFVPQLRKALGFVEQEEK